MKSCLKSGVIRRIGMLAVAVFSLALAAIHIVPAVAGGWIEGLTPVPLRDLQTIIPGVNLQGHIDLGSLKIGDVQVQDIGLTLQVEAGLAGRGSGRNTAAGKGTVIPFQVHLEQATISSPGIKGILEGTATGWLGPDSVRLESLNWDLTQGRVQTAQGWQSLPSLSLAASGKLIPRKDSLVLSKLVLSCDSKTIGKGSLVLDGQRSWRAKLCFDVQEAVDRGQDILPALPFRIQAADAQDRALLDVQVEISRPLGRGVAEVKAHLLRGCRLIRPKERFPATLPPGTFSATLPVGALSDAVGDQSAHWSWETDGPLGIGNATVAGLKADGEASWNTESFRLSSLSIRSKEVRFPAAGRTVRVRGPGAQLAMLSISAAHVSASTIHISLPDLGEFKASVRADPSTKSLVAGLEGEKLSAGGIARLLQVFFSDFPDLSLQGSARLQANLSLRRASMDAQLDLTLPGLSGSSPDGSLMAQNVAASWKTTLHGRKKMTVQTEVAVNGGEALWKSSYFNFAQQPIVVSANGTVPDSGNSGRLNIQAGWGGSAQVHAQGRLLQTGHHPVWLGKVIVQGWELSDLAAPLGLGLGSEQDSRVQGTAGFEGQLAVGMQGFRLAGRVHVQGVSANLPDRKVDIQDAGLELPVRLARGKSQDLPSLSPSAGQGWGMLRTGRITIAGKKVTVSPVPLALREDRLEVKDPITIAVPGLQMALQSVSILSPLKPSFELRCRLQVKELVPKRLIGQDIPVQGRMSGLFQEVSLNRQRLLTTGRLQGRLFQGDVRIDRIQVQRPFEQSRVLGCTLDIKGLNLQPLSRALDVGQITGLVNVRIEDLRIAFAQPVHFMMRAQSVPDPQMKRRISLKAVNALSIIGTGRGLSGVGISFYAKIFNEFPYQKIGLACSLKNDVFSISGLIHEGGKEYLVKRSLLGINVINSRPRNRIAFSDMLGRIRRIAEQSSAGGE